MIVTGTYENGELKLPESVRLKHARVEVKVDIPDEEIADQAKRPNTDVDMADPLDSLSDEGVRSMVRKLREIRGGGPTRGSGLSDKELLEDAFTTMSREESNRA